MIASENDIALDYGFSSHKAFSRAFREAYGITPSEYRKNPVPVVLRTVIKPFDCYFMDVGGTGMEHTVNDVKTYFVTIPEGKYLVFEHGPFDFETQNQSVEQKIEAAMKDFDYLASGYRLDTTPGRVFYFYHDCKRFWKYIRPVCPVHYNP